MELMRCTDWITHGRVDPLAASRGALSSRLLRRAATTEMATGDDESWEPPDGDHGHGDEASDIATDHEQEIRRPRKFKVLLHNDDYTSMDFVVGILRNLFHMSESKAVAVMLQIHERGHGVAGVFSREIAETKIKKATDMARSQEFPLRCTMEPE